MPRIRGKGGEGRADKRFQGKNGQGRKEDGSFKMKEGSP